VRRLEGREDGPQVCGHVARGQHGGLVDEHDKNEDAIGVETTELAAHGVGSRGQLVHVLDDAKHERQRARRLDVRVEAQMPPEQAFCWTGHGLARVVVGSEPRASALTTRLVLGHVNGEPRSHAQRRVRLLSDCAAVLVAHVQNDIVRRPAAARHVEAHHVVSVLRLGHKVLQALKRFSVSLDERAGRRAQHGDEQAQLVLESAAPLRNPKRKPCRGVEHSEWRRKRWPGRLTLQ